MDFVTFTKFLMGYAFGFLFSYGYHAWQLKNIQKKIAGPATYLPYRGMLPRLLVTSGVIFLALWLVPDPKFAFLIGMVLGMLTMTLWLLYRLTKQGVWKTPK